MERHRQDTGFQQFQQAEPGIYFFHQPALVMKQFHPNLATQKNGKNQGVSQHCFLYHPILQKDPKGTP